MNLYLIYDAHCAACSNIAATIERYGEKQIVPLSIYNEQAKTLLDTAFPRGWEFSPYLIQETPDCVITWSGMKMGFKLIQLLGLQNAWKIWRSIKSSINLTTNREQVSFLQRRQVMKMSFFCKYSSSRI